jgi:hypothetical protein
LMSEHQRNPANSCRCRPTHVTWNGRYYLTLPNPLESANTR